MHEALHKLVWIFYPYELWKQPYDHADFLASIQALRDIRKFFSYPLGYGMSQPFQYLL